MYIYTHAVSMIMNSTSQTYDSNGDNNNTSNVHSINSFVSNFFCGQYYPCYYHPLCDKNEENQFLCKWHVSYVHYALYVCMYVCMYVGAYVRTYVYMYASDIVIMIHKGLRLDSYNTA